jgi:hypothetical protein
LNNSSGNALCAVNRIGPIPAAKKERKRKIRKKRRIYSLIIDENKEKRRSKYRIMRTNLHLESKRISH